MQSALRDPACSAEMWHRCNAAKIFKTCSQSIAFSYCNRIVDSVFSPLFEATDKAKSRGEVMKNSGFRTRASLVTLAIAALSAQPAIAQEAADDADVSVEEIVVTGVAKATNRLDTSVSVSALDVDSVANVAPRGTAEIFRRLPGIRAESSAGGGNSNMQVRGLPAVTGGAQFISLQEDGLPVLLFGDHNFAPADGFVKVDATLARIESVRGGSAATLTTNGNGAIINLINKTGKTEGGSIQFMKGVDYKDTRVDAEYGASLVSMISISTSAVIIRSAAMSGMRASMQSTAASFVQA